MCIMIIGTSKMGFKGDSGKVVTGGATVNFHATMSTQALDNSKAWCLKGHVYFHNGHSRGNPGLRIKHVLCTLTHVWQIL